MQVNTINPVRASYGSPEKPAARSNRNNEAQDTSEDRESNVNVSRPELDRAVDHANDIGQLLKRKLNFSVDETTDKVVVKIIDEESGEVVRQIPPSEMLRIAAHLKQLQEMNDRVMSAVKSVILDLHY